MATSGMNPDAESDTGGRLRPELITLEELEDVVARYEQESHHR